MRARLGTAVALCVVLTLGGCGDETVDGLTADPVASAVPDGARLVDSSEEEADDGGLLGKPSPAEVRRTYALDSEADAQRALTELLAEAEAAGWEISSVAPDDSGFSASRPLGERTARLDVALNTDPAFPPAPGIFVSLRSPGD